MRSYNQFCPIAKAAEIFCERWTALIIRELAGGAMRFSQIQRGVPLASPALLSGRLKQLEKEGVVQREKSDSGKAWRYRLTESGEEFVPLVMALGVWGQRWSRRDLEPREMDLGLLLWALEKGANPDSLGPDRRVVQFDITDQPEHKRFWWFLNEDGHCELCLTPPDRDADIHVQATLAQLIRVWRGDVSLARVLDDGLIEVHGSARMRRAFGKWLGIASIAHIGPATTALS
jgi:DNA-binding HxlR family transcriptional regulator